MRQKHSAGFFSSNTQNLDVDTQQIQLAYSNPLFDNIGILCIELELPTGHRISNPCGSAVYIGEGFLITAAHCIQMTREVTTISLLDYPLLKPAGFTFKLINKEGSIHSEFKIAEEFVHPDYKSSENDLALLKLDTKIEHLTGFRVPEMYEDYFDNCIAVGFGMKGQKDGLFMSRDGLKRAITVPAIFAQGDFYYNINGYKLNYSNDEFHLDKIEDDPLAVGVSLGMSGGALINEKGRLLGITSHMFTPDAKLFGECNPLLTEEFKQSEWLRKTFRTSSAIFSYISSLPVIGLNPVTGTGEAWVNINRNPCRNWLLETMRQNSSWETYMGVMCQHEYGDRAERNYASI